MESSLFFELVDDVLLGVGRQALSGQRTERSIIEVSETDRVLQIIAGPGSRKTEMLIWRVLFEVFVHGRSTSRMVVTTFTEKAATELNVRVVDRSDALLAAARQRGVPAQDPRVHDLRIGTIHSLCDRLLQEFDPAHLAAGTVLIDEIESAVRIARDHRWALGRHAGRRVVDRLLRNDGLRAVFRAPWEDDGGFDAATDVVSFLQELLAQHTETWIPRCGDGVTPNGVERVHGPQGLTDDIVKLQRRWEEYLDDKGILDFATIQKRFFERQTAVVGELDHVFVDEFQDTNPIQYSLHTKWLEDGETRLTVVGDDDQSLYRFRGSDFECFRDLEPFCHQNGINFRQERLERNWRSTRRIVDFANAFRSNSVLDRLSLPKSLQYGGDDTGSKVRLVSGPWASVCEWVANDVQAAGAGRIPDIGEEPPPEAAILFFSTSERSPRSSALALRHAIEDRGVRVYNPRSKTAGQRGSPFYELFGLISYLVDPVVLAPVGNNGRNLEVWATRSDRPGVSAAAPTAPPDFRVSEAHASVQKGFRKAYGSISSHGQEIADLLEYTDQVRANLVSTANPRLTLAGFVNRLLSFDHFRNVGFTRELFREALFTNTLESHVAPTRLTRGSLDQPLDPQRRSDGKIVWDDSLWSFLNLFGQLILGMPLDDPDVEQFSEHAVSMMTFHQAKGLEFDRVYIGMSGRDPWPQAVLRTKLFSGEPVSYQVTDGQPITNHGSVLELATADREREVYVALSRAKSDLTFIVDPSSDYEMDRLNPVVRDLFDGASQTVINGDLTIYEYQA